MELISHHLFLLRRSFLARERLITVTTASAKPEVKILGTIVSKTVCATANLVSPETVTFSRAPPGAELQALADSGPVEAMEPVLGSPVATESSLELIQSTTNFGYVSLPEQDVCTLQPQPLHSEPAVCPVQLRSASSQSEVSTPAGSVSVSPPGGSGEPLQRHVLPAGGSGEPH